MVVCRWIDYETYGFHKKKSTYYLWLHLSFAVLQWSNTPIITFSFQYEAPQRKRFWFSHVLHIFFYFFFFNTHCSDARSRFFRPPTVKYTQDWSHTIIVPNRINNPSNISPITKSYNTKRVSTLKIRFLFFIQYKLPQRLELSAHRCRVKKMGDVIPTKQQRRGRWGGEG